MYLGGRGEPASMKSIWNGKLCHQGNTVGEMCLISTSNLPCTFPKSLEMHQKVSMKEFTEKAISKKALQFSNTLQRKNYTVQLMVIKISSHDRGWINILRYLRKENAVGACNISSTGNEEDAIFLVPTPKKGHTSDSQRYLEALPSHMQQNASQYIHGVVKCRKQRTGRQRSNVARKRAAVPYEEHDVVLNQPVPTVDVKASADARLACSGNESVDVIESDTSDDSTDDEDVSQPEHKDALRRRIKSDQFSSQSDGAMTSQNTSSESLSSETCTSPDPLTACLTSPPAPMFVIDPHNFTSGLNSQVTSVDQVINIMPFHHQVHADGSLSTTQAAISPPRSPARSTSLDAATNMNTTCADASMSLPDDVRQNLVFSAVHADRMRQMFGLQSRALLERRASLDARDATSGSSPGGLLQDNPPSRVCGQPEAPSGGQCMTDVRPGNLATDKHRSEDETDGSSSTAGQSVTSRDGLHSATTTDVRLAATASDGLQAAAACRGLQATPTSDTLQAATPSDGLQTAPTSDGLQATPTSDGLQAATTSDGLQAAAACRGLQATPTSDGLQAATPSDGLQTAAVNDGLQDSNTSCVLRAATNCDVLQATTTSDGFQAATTSGGLQAATTSGGLQATTTSDGFQAVTASDGLQTDITDVQQSGRDTVTSVQATPAHHVQCSEVSNSADADSTSEPNDDVTLQLSGSHIRKLQSLRRTFDEASKAKEQYDDTAPHRMLSKTAYDRLSQSLHFMRTVISRHMHFDQHDAVVSLLDQMLYNLDELPLSKGSVQHNLEKGVDTDICTPIHDGDTELSRGQDETDVTELSRGQVETDVTELSRGQDETDVTELSRRQDETDVTELSRRQDVSSTENILALKKRKRVTSCGEGDTQIKRNKSHPDALSVASLNGVSIEAVTRRRTLTNNEVIVIDNKATVTENEAAVIENEAVVTVLPAVKKRLKREPIKVENFCLTISDLERTNDDLETTNDDVTLDDILPPEDVKVQDLKCDGSDDVSSDSSEEDEDLCNHKEPIKLKKARVVLTDCAKMKDCATLMAGAVARLGTSVSHDSDDSLSPIAGPEKKRKRCARVLLSSSEESSDESDNDDDNGDVVVVLSDDSIADKVIITDRKKATRVRKKKRQTADDYISISDESILIVDSGGKPGKAPAGGSKLKRTLVDTVTTQAAKQSLMDMPMQVPAPRRRKHAPASLRLKLLCPQFSSLEDCKYRPSDVSLLTTLAVLLRRVVGCMSRAREVELLEQVLSPLLRSTRHASVGWLQTLRDVLSSCVKLLKNVTAKGSEKVQAKVTSLADPYHNAVLLCYNAAQTLVQAMLEYRELPSNTTLASIKRRELQEVFSGLIMVRGSCSKLRIALRKPTNWKLPGRPHLEHVFCCFRQALNYVCVSLTDCIVRVKRKQSVSPAGLEVADYFSHGPQQSRTSASDESSDTSTRHRDIDNTVDAIPCAGDAIPSTSDAISSASGDHRRSRVEQVCRTLKDFNLATTCAPDTAVVNVMCSLNAIYRSTTYLQEVGALEEALPVLQKSVKDASEGWLTELQLIVKACENLSRSARPASNPSQLAKSSVYSVKQRYLALSILFRCFHVAVAAEKFLWQVRAHGGHIKESQEKQCERLMKQCIAAGANLVASRKGVHVGRYLSRRSQSLCWLTERLNQALAELTDSLFPQATAASTEQADTDHRTVSGDASMTGTPTAGPSSSGDVGTRGAHTAGRSSRTDTATPEASATAPSSIGGGQRQLSCVKQRIENAFSKVKPPASSKGNAARARSVDALLKRIYSSASCAEETAAVHELLLPLLQSTEGADETWLTWVEEVTGVCLQLLKFPYVVFSLTDEIKFNATGRSHDNVQVSQFCSALLKVVKSLIFNNFELNGSTESLSSLKGSNSNLLNSCRIALGNLSKSKPSSCYNTTAGVLIEALKKVISALDYIKQCLKNGAKEQFPVIKVGNIVPETAGVRRQSLTTTDVTKQSLGAADIAKLSFTAANGSKRLPAVQARSEPCLHQPDDWSPTASHQSDCIKARMLQICPYFGDVSQSPLYTGECAIRLWSISDFLKRIYRCPSFSAEVEAIHELLLPLLSSTDDADVTWLGVVETIISDCFSLLKQPYVIDDSGDMTATRRSQSDKDVSTCCHVLLVIVRGLRVNRSAVDTVQKKLPAISGDTVCELQQCNERCWSTCRSALERVKRETPQCGSEAEPAPQWRTLWRLHKALQMLTTALEANKAVFANQQWQHVSTVNVSDAGQRDPGQRDAGQRDAGQRGAVQRDTGQRDAGRRNARQRDAGQRDAGQRDAIRSGCSRVIAGDRGGDSRGKSGDRSVHVRSAAAGSVASGMLPLDDSPVESSFSETGYEASTATKRQHKHAQARLKEICPYFEDICTCPLYASDCAARARSVDALLKRVHSSTSFADETEAVLKLLLPLLQSVDDAGITWLVLTQRITDDCVKLLKNPYKVQNDRFKTVEHAALDKAVMRCFNVLLCAVKAVIHNNVMLPGERDRSVERIVMMKRKNANLLNECRRSVDSLTAEPAQAASRGRHLTTAMTQAYEQLRHFAQQVVTVLTANKDALDAGKWPVFTEMRVTFPATARSATATCTATDSSGGGFGGDGKPTNNEQGQGAVSSNPRSTKKNSAASSKSSKVPFRDCYDEPQHIFSSKKGSSVEALEASFHECKGKSLQNVRLVHFAQSHVTSAIAETSPDVDDIDKLMQFYKLVRDTLQRRLGLLRSKLRNGAESRDERWLDQQRIDVSEPSVAQLRHAYILYKGLYAVAHACSTLRLMKRMFNCFQVLREIQKEVKELGMLQEALDAAQPPRHVTIDLQHKIRTLQRDLLLKGKRACATHAGAGWRFRQFVSENELYSELLNSCQAAETGTRTSGMSTSSASQQDTCSRTRAAETGTSTSSASQQDTCSRTRAAETGTSTSSVSQQDTCSNRAAAADQISARDLLSASVASLHDRWSPTVASSHDLSTASARGDDLKAPEKAASRQVFSEAFDKAAFGEDLLVPRQFKIALDTKMHVLSNSSELENAALLDLLQPLVMPLLQRTVVGISHIDDQRDFCQAVQELLNQRMKALLQHLTDDEAGETDDSKSQDSTMGSLRSTHLLYKALNYMAQVCIDFKRLQNHDWSLRVLKNQQRDVSALDAPANVKTAFLKRLADLRGRVEELVDFCGPADATTRSAHQANGTDVQRSREDNKTAMQRPRKEVENASQTSRGDGSAGAEGSRGDDSAVTQSSRGDGSAVAEGSHGDDSAVTQTSRGDGSVGAEGSHSDDSAVTQSSRGENEAVVMNSCDKNKAAARSDQSPVCTTDQDRRTVMVAEKGPDADRQRRGDVTSSDDVAVPVAEWGERLVDLIKRADDVTVLQQFLPQAASRVVEELPRLGQHECNALGEFIAQANTYLQRDASPPLQQVYRTLEVMVHAKRYLPGRGDQLREREHVLDVLHKNINGIRTRWPNDPLVTEVRFAATDLRKKLSDVQRLHQPRHQRYQPYCSRRYERRDERREASYAGGHQQRRGHQRALQSVRRHHRYESDDDRDPHRSSSSHDNAVQRQEFDGVYTHMR